MKMKKNKRVIVKRKKRCGGHSRCKWRCEASLKFNKKNSRGESGWGRGWGVWGVRVDVNGEKSSKDAFLKIIFFCGGGGGGGGSGWGSGWM